MADVAELENQWLQARFAADYKTRQPRYEIDARYRHEVDKLQFELEMARAESRKPAAAATVNTAADMDLLNRAMAVDGGRAYFNDAKFRGRIEAMRSTVVAGGAIPADVRAATEADLALRGANK